MARAARYNRLLTIERLTDVSDGQGGSTREWVAIAQTYGRAIQIGGSSALQAGSLQHSQPWRVEIPFQSNLTEQDRFTADWLPAGWALSIDSLLDADGRARELTILGTASVF